MLEAQEAFAKFNLEHLTPDWTSKQGFYAADSASLEKRAQWVRQFLRERPEQHIAVVAHGDFLRRLTDEPTSYWANAEVRVFEFAPNAVTTDACPLVFVDHVEKGDWKGTASSTGVAHTSDLSSMEERVRQIQASVMSQTSELEQLDKMLAAAEQKQVHLESQMGSSDPSA